MEVTSNVVWAATVPPNFTAGDQAEYVKTTLMTEPAGNGLSSIRTQYQRALWTLMVVAGLVLLIACANVANLLLARAAMRQKEVAIRMAVGASRLRLIRQLLTESLVLSFAGAGLGILFAQWGARVLVRLLSTTSPVSLDLAIDLRVLGFTIAAAILTGVLFGMAPAWKGARVDPQVAMKVLLQIAEPINGRIYNDRDEPTLLRRGRRYRLAFNNRSPEAHPLHLHRYTFELVRIGAHSTAGLKKDVITLQPYQTAEVDIVPREAGLALFHCHQQMHMEMGFKRLFRVI
jgi:hypothetical protein